MSSKSKILVAMAFVFTLIFSTATTDAHYQISNEIHKFSINEELDSYNQKKVELAKQKFRCKLCGKTFNTGIVCAGHIRGNHGKWLIHKYYEKI